MNRQVYVYKYKCMYPCVHACMYSWTCMDVSMYACMHVWMDGPSCKAWSLGYKFRFQKFAPQRVSPSLTLLLNAQLLVTSLSQTKVRYLIQCFLQPPSQWGKDCAFGFDSTSMEKLLVIRHVVWNCSPCPCVSVLRAPPFWTPRAIKAMMVLWVDTWISVPSNFV